MSEKNTKIKKNILLLARNLDNPCSGESISFFTFTNLLKKKHNILVFSIEKKNIRKKDFVGIKLTSKSIIKKIRKKIIRLPPSFETILLQLEIFSTIKHDLLKKTKKFKPDLIIYQKDLAPVGCWIAKKLKVPSVLKVHDYEFSYNWSAHEWNELLKLALHIPVPFYKTICNFVLKESNLIIANSERTANIYRKINSNPNIESIYGGFTELSDYKTEKIGKKILHMTPGINKGIFITLAVAEKMPDEKFIITGSLKGIKKDSIKKKIESLDNVEYLGFIDDILNVFSQTKIVLVPSLDEGFGRIVIEAGASGIPAITSGNGGLYDSSIHELIVKENKPDEYIKKIREIKNNYDKYSKISIKNAEKKSAEKVFETFKQLLREKTGVKL